MKPRSFLPVVMLVSTSVLMGAPPEIAPLASPVPQSKAFVYHGRFDELPVGAVKPHGWIEAWLKRQADGLSGRPENLAYPYDTCLFAGKIPAPVVPHGETWWPYEQAGYLVDGVVRLNHLIEHPAITRLAATNLNYLRESSGPGKLGESVWGWPNAVVGRALMAEHSATGDPKLAGVLATFFSQPQSWQSRDGYVFEQALYLYRRTGDERLLAAVKDAYARFFISDPKSFSHVDKLRGPSPVREHGVTAAEQLKLLPLMYTHTGDEQALALADYAYRKIEADSLMPDGGMVSPENLGTAAFNSLHETCDITDWSWSIGYLLAASGEGHWADLIERTTFNALPGAVTKDFKQLQYFSSANQVLAASTACPRISPPRMSYRAAHDTECCSGNVSRAMPNYVSRMWMKSDTGLAATLYGPCTLTTAIAGRAITITEQTDYPFRETIAFTIAVSAPVSFPLSLRIPEWCEGATITVNGRDAGLVCEPGKFATLTREFRDGDSVVLRLPMRVQLERWFADRAVVVKRGPLVYSLKLAEKRVESLADVEMIRRLLKGNNIQGFPAEEFFSAGEWRFGVKLPGNDADTGGVFKVIESPMTENPFIADAAPVRIEMSAHVLPRWLPAWVPVIEPAPADIKGYAHNPSTLPAAADLDQIGPAQTVTLVPYGATHLRLTTFPVIKNATAKP